MIHWSKKDPKNQKKTRKPPRITLKKTASPLRRLQCFAAPCSVQGCATKWQLPKIRVAAACRHSYAMGWRTPQVYGSFSGEHEDRMMINWHFFKYALCSFVFSFIHLFTIYLFNFIDSLLIYLFVFFSYLSYLFSWLVIIYWFSLFSFVLYIYILSIYMCWIFGEPYFHSHPHGWHSRYGHLRNGLDHFNACPRSGTDFWPGQVLAADAEEGWKTE